MSATRILGGIYLSSIEPINKETDLRAEYNISSILSVLPGEISETFTSNYNWKQISVTDEVTTNLIQHFDECCDFIDKATENGGKVLVHCAQGVSRSVTVIMAYLMKKHKLMWMQALHAVRRKEPAVMPNRGFLEQLSLYADMNYKVDPENPKYKAFLKKLSLEQDPTGEQLRQETMAAKEQFYSSTNVNESGAAKTASTYDLRCRKCRNVLANNSHVDEHEVPQAESKQSKFIKTAPNSRRIISVQNASDSCSHFFVKEPMDWMRKELENEAIEGKFQCPKCDAKVGGYSWRGSRCSCGKWMVPALHLQQSKLDKMYTHL
ncbi:uncharacterized protein LODBEIA_P08170 [Lodderomyces beijingensis]|uniref:protein-tyrosine-phosphatase n=1 Tax=Lodderomyces beijingensis TaxID=1775926 RepID=A0ABP0ZEL3_9ASCO